MKCGFFTNSECPKKSMPFVNPNDLKKDCSGEINSLSECAYFGAPMDDEDIRKNRAKLRGYPLGEFKDLKNQIERIFQKIDSIEELLHG